MKHPLRRLLKLRALMEELSQLELERRHGEVRRLEAAAERGRAEARTTRRDALRRLEAGDPEWGMDFADADLLAWKSGNLLALAEARRPEVEAARAEFLERRLERRQVETLVEEAAAAEAIEDGRREQKSVDDWFQGQGRGERFQGSR